MFISFFIYFSSFLLAFFCICSYFKSSLHEAAPQACFWEWIVIKDILNMKRWRTFRNYLLLNDTLACVFYFDDSMKFIQKSVLDLTDLANIFHGCSVGCPHQESYFFSSAASYFRKYVVEKSKNGCLRIVRWRQLLCNNFDVSGLEA